mgnify:CR=1 FL=1
MLSPETFHSKILPSGPIQVALLDEAGPLTTMNCSNLVLCQCWPLVMLAWSVNGYLAGVAGVDEPGEGAALVHVLLQRESRLLFGQVAEVSAVKLLCKRSVGNLRNHQCPGLSRELFQQHHNLPHRRQMRRWHIAVAADLVILRRTSVILRRSRRIFAIQTIIQSLTVPDIPQLRAQVLSYEPLCAGTSVFISKPLFQ